MRDAQRGVAVNHGLEWGQAGKQPLAKRAADFLALLRFGEREFGGPAERGNQRDRQRPRPDSKLLTAAVKKRSEGRALAAAAAGDQGANPLRRVNLVAA